MAAADELAAAWSSKENMGLLAMDASEAYEWAKAELLTVQKKASAAGNDEHSPAGYISQVRQQQCS